MEFLIYQNVSFCALLTLNTNSGVIGIARQTYYQTFISNLSNYINSWFSFFYHIKYNIYQKNLENSFTYSKQQKILNTIFNTFTVGITLASNLLKGYLSEIALKFKMHK